MVSVFNIDWAQFYFVCPVKPIERLEYLSHYYAVKKLQYGNKYYANCYEVCDKVNENIRFGHLSICPHSSILDANGGIIKIDNRILYDRTLLLGFLDAFAELMQFYPEDYKVSRLDLCLDFNEFLNDLHPHQVISDFAGNKLRKIGKSKFALYGTQFKGAYMKYSGLRFGVHGSEMSIYLYNKTLELKEKENKPYIVEKWQEFGLDVDNVWRLELSLSPKTPLYVDKTTGEQFKIDYFLLKDVEKLNRFYYLVATKQFRFCRVEEMKGQNISRQKPLPLISSNFQNSVSPLYNHSNSTTYDKGIYNYLRKFVDTHLIDEIKEEQKRTYDIALNESAYIIKRLLKLN